MSYEACGAFASISKVKNKFAFITCVNNKSEYRNCVQHINRLKRANIKIQIIPIYNSHSITSGYNMAMHKTNAKYKVYLHQDTIILNPKFIFDCLRLFRTYPKLGMLGVCGTKGVPRSGIWWEGANRYGKVIHQPHRRPLIFKQPEGDFKTVDMIDGLIMVTQYDIPWREDIIKGFHFYDASQSMEFRRRGYWIGIPRQRYYWCYHQAASKLDPSFRRLQRVFRQKYLGVKASD